VREETGEDAEMRIYEDLRGLQRRVGVLQTVVLACFAVLVGYFWHLQVVKGKYYQELAENNRLRAVTLPAPRGAIFDRHGRVLVENRSSFNIVLTPEHVEDLPGTVARLAALLEMPPELIRQRLQTRGPRFKSVVVKADASEEDVARVDARRFEQPGVGVDVVPLRSYPLARGAAHGLGRVGEVTDRQLASTAFAGIEPGTVVGQAGIEQQYNRLLMGQDGVRRVIVNSRGVEVDEAEQVAPRDGPSATLTIDAELQAAVEEALEGRAGSVAALDPETGEVLALVSSPSYDPNLFASGIEPGTWSGLINDPQTPLVNRVVQQHYPPGSTFKIIMALAGLQEGVISPNTSFSCNGGINLYGTYRRCHKAGGHGTLDLRGAIAQSCNVYFYQVGVRLEIERIAAYARRLGLGAATGIDLPNEVTGLIPSPEWKQRTQGGPWYPGETVSVAIGQGPTMVTTLQMARLAAVVANGGRLVKPHLLKSIKGQSEAGQVAERQDLGLKPSVLATVREAMTMVVEGGTGWRARLTGIKVAGKTGSSQVVTHARLERDKNAPELQPHGWFVGFAPADNPRIALAVLVEHGRSGGESAAPVAGRILARYFKVPPPGTVVPAPQVALQAPDREE
jgi:penicillin-binding protein 2